MPSGTSAVLIGAVVVIVLILLRRLRPRRTMSRPADPTARSTGAAPSEGGWKALAARWPAGDGPHRPIATRATIGLGAVRWKNCMRVGADRDGLRLEVAIPLIGRIGTRPVRLPWSALGEGEATRLYGRTALRIPVGTPAVATLVLPTDLWRLLEAARHPPDPSETTTGRDEIPDPPR